MTIPPQTPQSRPSWPWLLGALIGLLTGIGAILRLRRRQRKQILNWAVLPDLPTSVPAEIPASRPPEPPSPVVAEAPPAPEPISTNTSAWTTVTLLAGGLLFAILGQYLYTVQQNLGGATVFYSIAFVQWTVALTQLNMAWPGLVALTTKRKPKRDANFLEDEDSPAFTYTSLRLLQGFWGVAFGSAAFALAWDEFIDPLLLITWISGMIVWWLALSETQVRLPLDKWRRAFAAFRQSREVWAALAILLIGGFALFYGLAYTPSEMISDHAENFLDVANVLDGEYRIYMPNNSGREPAFTYLAALAATFFGPSFMSMKFISALAAWLTLPAIYALGRAINGRLAGFLAALLAAVSVWTMISGRLGFRSTLAMLASALLLLALWRALRTNRRADFLLVGLVLGLGQYGYTAFRFAPLLVVAAVGLRWLEVDPPQRRRLLVNLGATLTMSLMAFVPLLSFWIRFPEIFWFRASAQVGEVGLGVIGGAIDGLVKSLLMFNFVSDPVALNVVPRPAWPGSQIDAVTPALGSVTGALFLLGLIFWVWIAYRQRRPMWGFIPLAFLIFLLPSALGLSRPNELPSARRAIAALPPLMIMAGSALALPVYALDSLRRRQLGRVLAVALIGVVVGLSAVINFRDYFDAYGLNYHVRTQPQREVAAEIRRFQEQGVQLDNTYLIYGIGHGWVEPRAVSAWLGEPRWHEDHVLAEVDPARCIEWEHPLLVLFGQGDEASLDQLAACFPKHEISAYNIRDRGQYVFFFVP